MEICPTCKNRTVIYDEYFKRKRCLLVNCSWSELSNKEEPTMTSIRRSEVIA